MNFVLLLRGLMGIIGVKRFRVMAENSVLRNRPDFPRLEIKRRWQAVRSCLILAVLSLATPLTFLAILTTLDWLRLFFGGGDVPAMILSTLATLFVFPYLRRWSKHLVDFLFFPDTAGFKEEVDAACQALIEIDDRISLKDFLTYQLPSKLCIDNVVLSEGNEPIPLNSLKLPLEMSGRFLGTLWVGQKCSGRSFADEELSALKQLQEQVSLVLSVIQLKEAREIAEQTDRLKSNFLSNISHELRTPLNSVINLTGLVADGSLGPISREQAKFLQQAVKGSEYLMNLLDDILDMTKIETGQLTLRFEWIELPEIIEEAVTIARSMLKNKQVRLEAEIVTELPAIIADRLRLRQILLNLLSNASKFTQEGYILVKAWLEQETVFVSVEDTGIGIAKEDLPLIFQDYRQFLQLNKADKLFTRRRHLGTGLGMSITQALVELHGGQIKVKSEVRQGSTFIFTLPISKEVVEVQTSTEYPLGHLHS